MVNCKIDKWKNTINKCSRQNNGERKTYTKKNKGSLKYSSKNVAYVLMEVSFFLVKQKIVTTLNFFSHSRNFKRAIILFFFPYSHIISYS